MTAPGRAPAPGGLPTDSARVPDEVWEEATRHYDERALVALIISVASINFWNRLNATTRQVAGAWKP